MLRLVYRLVHIHRIHTHVFKYVHGHGPAVGNVDLHIHTQVRTEFVPGMSLRTCMRLSVHMPHYAHVCTHAYAHVHTHVYTSVHALVYRHVCTCSSVQEISGAAIPGSRARMLPKYIGHDYGGYNYVDHNYVGHNYIGQ